MLPVSHSIMLDTGELLLFFVVRNGPVINILWCCLMDVEHIYICAFHSLLLQRAEFVQSYSIKK